MKIITKARSLYVMFTFSLIVFFFLLSSMNSVGENISPDVSGMSTHDAWVVVGVDLNMKHSVGKVDRFDRSKFITQHSDLSDNEWPDARMRDAFFEEYDVYLGRSNGSLPWQLSRLESTAADGYISRHESQKNGEQNKRWYSEFFSNNNNADKLEHRAKNMMYGGQMNMYPHRELNLECSENNNPCNKTNEWLHGFDALGEYFSVWLSDYFGTGGTTGEPKPRIIEVVNEPMWNAEKYRASPQSISELHAVVAKKIKANHSDVKVGGYTAAWPGIEENSFSTFDRTWKTFIDVAGEEMDFYSIHFYDGFRDGKHAYRSGANLEAVLDTIDQYSILRTGERKPWVVSEYGYFSPVEEPELRDAGYSKLRDWYNIRSFSSIMMSLLDRPDQVISAIPFHILKALWYGQNGIDKQGRRYSTRLFVMEKELDGEKGHVDDGKSPYIYSEIIKWYQLWSEVKGIRVDSHSTDPDLQVDSYIDGNVQYLILNNLEAKKAQTVLLRPESRHWNLVTQVSSKHLYYDKEKETPVLEEKRHWPFLFRKFQVDAEATAIIKLTYARDISIDELSRETRYYANDYRKTIVANSSIQFDIDNVDLSGSHGEAVIRVSVARDHNKKKFPTVFINGIALESPTDVRGYYENNARSQFFGVIEIPVPHSALHSDNNIQVRFPDDGGTISAVTMQVYNMTTSPIRY